MIEDINIFLFAQSGEAWVSTESGNFYRKGRIENQDANEIVAFVEMCEARKLEPASEILKAIQARYDAMLAE